MCFLTEFKVRKEREIVPWPCLGEISLDHFEVWISMTSTFSAPDGIYLDVEKRLMGTVDTEAEHQLRDRAVKLLSG